MPNFPSLTGQQIVDEARTMLGTPWKHTGRIPGVGIDCAGLLSLTFQNLGVPVADNITYSLNDEFRTLLAEIRKYSDEIEGDPQLGDVLVFSGRTMWNHCGIYTGNNRLIHAYSSPSIMKVVEHSINSEWPLVRIYRYKNIWQQ
jgi:cell wall-associated NlpC family hydrolase